MNTIKVINPGVLTTIQDCGRIGFQQYGIPISGAMDLLSLQLANILVDNDKNEACLEMTMVGPTIEFNFNTSIAITGADMMPQINGNSVRMYETIYIKSGDVLKFSTAKSGFRSYLSVQGGFDIPKVIGSKSTYIRGKIGGYEGRKLKNEDEIKINKISKLASKRKIPYHMISEYKQKEIIRVILGPEEESFSKLGLKTFLNSEYEISNQFDRMGYKLNGPKIDHKTKPDIISTGITLGTIQVSGNGQPMVMLSDKQTTGGYTRIANVITIDIQKFGQLKSGNKIKFEKIELKKAQKLFIEQQKKIQELIDVFKKVNDRNVKYYSISVNNKKYNVTLEKL